MNEITKVIPKEQAKSGFTPPKGYNLKKVEQLPTGDLVVTWELNEVTSGSTKDVLLG